MSLARVIIAFLLLLLPRIAAADPSWPWAAGLGYTNNSDYGFAYADERVGGAFTLYEDNYDSQWPDSRVNGHYVIGGYIEMTSGPFVRETDYPDSWGTHRGAAYAAGGTATASWVVALPEDTRPEDGNVTGTRVIDFTATLGAFEVFYGISDSPYDMAWASDTSVPITSWRIDRDDADFVGMSYHRGNSGEWTLYLDYYPDWLSDGPDLQGFRSYGVLNTAAVPEPGLAALLLTGLGGTSLRRWRQGRRASRRIPTTSVPHDEPDLDELAAVALRQSWEQHQREKRLERIAMLEATLIIVLAMGALAAMYWIA